MNFLFGPHGDRPDAAEVARSIHDTDAHHRLTGLKARHDPANLFRFHSAATPAPAAVPV